jgi:lipoprotein NlpI
MIVAKHLLLAMTNPLPGRDDAFNEWYDNVAYPTYKSLPGLVPLGRFKAVDVPKMFPFQMDKMFEYLSLYYFETDDPEAFLETLKATFPKRPEYQFSEDIDQSRFFEPIYVAMDDINFAPIDNYESLKR